MAVTLQWLKENTGDFSRQHEGNKVFIRNAYSQWVLRKGRDFELSEEIGKEHPDDFGYVEMFDSLLGDSNVKPMDGNTINRLVPFDFLSGNVRDENGTDLPSNEVFAALPVRASSVLPENRKVIPPTYESPEGVEKEKMVIVGIIDDSINIAHNRLQTKAGDSRVDFAWIQDAKVPDQCPPDGDHVPYGKHLTRAQITDAIATFGEDHDGLIRHLGLVGTPGQSYRPSPLKFRQSHGTLVADLVAGYDQNEDIDHATGLETVNRRLITVQLPALVTQDTSAASLIAATRSAVKFIFNRAEIISKSLKYPIPVVLNFSYSLSGGGRTAEHLIDRIMRKAALNYRKATASLVDPKAKLGAPVSLVVPAGNLHLSQSHGIGTINKNSDPQEGLIDLQLRLQPNDQTSSYLEIWVPRTAESVEIKVTYPTGRQQTLAYKLPEPALSGQSHPPKLHPSWALVAVGDGKGQHPVCRISLDEPHSTLPQIVDPAPLYWRFLFAFAPTECLEQTRPVAPHGVWNICASSKGTHKPMRAWVQRDAAVPGSKPKGRQAYLEDEEYDRTKFQENGDIAIDDTSVGGCVYRNGTITGFGGETIKNDETKTALIEPILVGSNRWNTGAGSFFSPAGYKNAQEDVKGPHAMGVSEASRVLPYLLVAGSRNGSVTAATGTSLSTPQVARWLADKVAITTGANRVNFDSVNALTAADTPTRPVGTELTTAPPVRAERLRDKGTFLIPIQVQKSMLARRIKQHE